MLQIKVAFPPAWGQDPAGAEYMYSRYIIVIYKRKKNWYGKDKQNPSSSLMENDLQCRHL